MKRDQPVLQLARLLPLAGQRQILHLGHQLGRHVGSYRDTALTATYVVGYRGSIFTGEPGKGLFDQLTLDPWAGQIAGGILHPGDARQFGQASQSRRLHIDDGAGRNVIDDDGLGGGIMYCLEVMVESFLIGTVVITGHMQGGIGPNPLSMEGVFDRFDRVVGAGPGDHRNAPRHLLDHQLHYPAVFVVSQGRTLACGPDRHYAMGTLLDMPLHQTQQRLFIQLALSKRGNQGNDWTLKHGISFS